MRKFIINLLFIVLIVGVLQGCGKPEGYNTEIESHVYNIKGGVKIYNFGLADKNHQKLSFNVPGEPYECFLYWAGRSYGPLEDDFLVIDGKKVKCDLIYGEKPGAPPAEIQYIFTYKKEITGLVKEGKNEFSVWGFDAYENEGMSIVVLYKDEKSELKKIELKEGMGFFWSELDKEKKNSELLSYDFKPSGKARKARLNLLIAGGGPSPRNDNVWTLVKKEKIKGKNIIGEGQIIFKNEINSNILKKWDELSKSIIIPAESQHLYVQIESPEDTPSEHNGDSANFVVSLFELPLKE